ncbi:MAG: FAD-binding protein [Firmicutes bacterium]|nr:FAD-binding protein [Bacillota bacterium]
MVRRPKQRRFNFSAFFLLMLTIFFLTRYSFLNEPPPEYHLPQSVDVIVVGSGLSGNLAAIAAAQAGAQVIYFNLSTEIAAAPPYPTVFWAAGTTYQKKTEQEILPETLALHLYRRGKETANYAQLLTLCLSSAESLHWLEELTGQKFSRLDDDNIAMHWPAEENAYLNILAKTKNILSSLVTERKNCLPISLLTDGEEIAGLKVRNENGEEEEIRAQAVILADGGYASNKEMLKTFAGVSGIRARSDGSFMGIALELAQKLGAQTAALEKIFLQPILVSSGEGIDNFTLEDVLLVSATGKIVKASATLEELLADNDGTLFVVTGKNHPLRQQLAMQSFSDRKDLAALLQVPLPVLEEHLFILEPPYQLAVLGLVALNPGGLVVTEKYQVMGQETIIAGLYAAGELTAGLHGSKIFADLFFTEAVVSARIAGLQAAKYALR